MCYHSDEKPDFQMYIASINASYFLETMFLLIFNVGVISPEEISNSAGINVNFFTFSIPCRFF